MKASTLLSIAHARVFSMPKPVATFRVGASR
jgi:hypothetical protein